MSLRPLPNPSIADPLACPAVCHQARDQEGTEDRGRHDAEIVPWARVTVSLPANILAAPDFANEPQVGWGHGDDRGEFLVVLGANAVPGGATLPTSMPLRVWVFLPPVGAFDPDHALDSLPLEQAESDAISQGFKPSLELVEIRGGAQRLIACGFGQREGAHTDGAARRQYFAFGICELSSAVTSVQQSVITIGQ